MHEADFWKLTPRQTARVLEAQHRRAIQQHNERAWLAWHIAALSRAKKIPRLQTMIHSEQRKPQTWQEQLAIAQQWVARGAGTISGIH